VIEALFAMHARYNEWANGRLYAAAGALDEYSFRMDCGAFFGSLQRTLNHLVVTDRIWMHRFTGEGPLHRALDEVPYPAFDALASARRAEDARILAFVDSLDAARLAGRFRYRPVTRPVDIEQPLAPALSHLFNHQTHHRGQCHAMLTRLAGKAPELDLILFQRESGVGM